VRKEDGSKAICATDYWELTKLIAWRKYAIELNETGPLLVRALKDAQAALTECIDQGHKAATKIAQLIGGGD
jgi:hypothetical protein